MYMYTFLFLSHYKLHYSMIILFIHRMLAYRCEDIHTRLESHELYTRQELETTIQIDVCMFHHKLLVLH